MTARSEHFDADVLIVGTGPMGATAALALATYGVSVISISRKNWLADSPRAHVTNLRAMEVLRALGVEERALALATPWELMGDTTFTTSLAGPEIARIASFGLGPRRYGEYRAASPCTMADLPQPLLEPLLVDAAASRGAVFAFSTLYRSHEQDATGVTVVLEDRTSGHVSRRRVRYLIGADGARSQVADDAGISLVGQMRRGGTVYAQFSGDLSARMNHRSSILTWIVNETAAVGEIGLGLLRAVRPWDRWIAGWGFDVEAGEPDVSHDVARARIRSYVGDPDFEPEITAVNPWYVNEAWAPVYSSGRVFCGGDAVHRHPPSNGLGSNTSVQDAYNLAWKIAFVLRGYAGPELLDSYSDERSPIGEQVVRRANQSRREYAGVHVALAADQPGSLAGAAKLTAPTPAGARARELLASVLDLKDNEYNALGVEMNQRYASNAVHDLDEAPEVFQRDRDVFAQHTTRPGAKLPHAWLVDASGNRISTLDLVDGERFTLLTGPSGQGWADAVLSLGLPYLRATVIGSSNAQDLWFDWSRIREVAEDGAILVRPDGYIAWRSNGAVPSSRRTLGEVLARLLSQ
ncbi:FAD-dependent monooxygenase [Microbacterium sp. HD4P20]|uniref:FAD-dependent monooxygenase n=1 Tax=Microbacterium sp. HD4P20 TaxID=2864874 RepID=UPI001C643D7D|nr:FAD-dependent monooxygenase [Microbacterium sp. HD4P20]MCP2636062.1 FAD-dependent monooxygenase [Microbacterium sp. HD4P20]